MEDWILPGQKLFETGKECFVNRLRGVAEKQVNAALEHRTRRTSQV